MKYVLARKSHAQIPKLPGIYVISSRYGRHVYIGSTFCFNDRFGKHLSKLIRKKHPNKKLQNLFDKEQVLFFAPIKTCEQVEMMRFEQDYLNKYGPKALNSIKQVRHYRRKIKC